jgi:hypothetical protein
MEYWNMLLQFIVLTQYDWLLAMLFTADTVISPLNTVAFWLKPTKDLSKPACDILCSQISPSNSLLPKCNTAVQDTCKCYFSDGHMESSMAFPAVISWNTQMLSSILHRSIVTNLTQMWYWTKYIQKVTQALSKSMTLCVPVFTNPFTQ